MKNNKFFYTPHAKFYANFYITYFCNLACKICLMGCNPKIPKQFLPLEDILFYAKEFEKDECFSKSTVINGGEATSTYFYYSEDYLQTLYSELLKRSCKIELHTNSVWATSNKAEKIWQDLKILADFGNKNTIDLSCDQYHNNLSGLRESFKVLSSPDFVNKKLNINLLSFTNDPVVNNVIKEIKNYYPNLNITYAIEGEIIKTGTAKKYGLGVKVPFFEYHNEYCGIYYWSDEKLAISFHPDRTACIGTFYNPKRRVSYVNKDNKLKPWEQLYPELMENYIKSFKKDGCDLLELADIKEFLIPKKFR